MCSSDSVLIMTTRASVADAVERRECDGIAFWMVRIMVWMEQLFAVSISFGWPVLVWGGVIPILTSETRCRHDPTRNRA